MLNAHHLQSTIGVGGLPLDLVARWNYNDNTDDLFEINNQAISGITSYVDSDQPGGRSLDLDTNGYSQKISIDNNIKTVAGTILMRLKRKSLSSIDYVAFSQDGTVGDEFLFAFRESRGDARSLALELVILDGGSTKIDWYTDVNSINFLDEYFTVRVAADGSGVNPHRVFINDIEVGFDVKDQTTAGFLGVWLGSGTLSNANSMTVGGIKRVGTVGVSDNLVIDNIDMYDAVILP